MAVSDIAGRRGYVTSCDVGNRAKNQVTPIAVQNMLIKNELHGQLKLSQGEHVTHEQRILPIKYLLHG